jgi:hypothetical protein
MCPLQGVAEAVTLSRLRRKVLRRVEPAGRDGIPIFAGLDLESICCWSSWTDEPMLRQIPFRGLEEKHQYYFQQYSGNLVHLGIECGGII